jgi:arylsulfatase A-like enzyme
MKIILITCFALLQAFSLRAGDKPNIIFILADDLGYGDVGCYNPESKISTPNLDKLAAEGMRFLDAHSAATVCTPSRYSLLTGRLAYRTGSRGVFTGAGGPGLIEEGRLTLPGILRDKGYTTACIGKWHIGLSFFDKDGNAINENGLPAAQRIDYSRSIPDAPIHRGFDKFFGTACCPTTDFIYAYIDGDRIPVPPTQLEDQSQIAKHAYSIHRQGMIAPGFDLEEVDMLFLDKSIAFMKEHTQKAPDKPFFLFHSAQAVHLPSLPGKAFKGKTGKGPHGDFIFQFDHIVGQLMKAVETLGISDNTIIMISSDNGPEAMPTAKMRKDHQHDSAAPWRGFKRDQYEGGHRVPFIVRWPAAVEAGSLSRQTVCLSDIIATCADLLGTKLPNDAAEDSWSLLPELLGTQGSEPIRAYTIHQTNRNELAVRRGPWKYLAHKGSGGYDYNKSFLKAFDIADSAPKAPGQLYNLDSDPKETVNLYLEHPEIVRELKNLLENSLKSGRSAPLR